MKNKDNLDSKKEKKVNKIKEQLARLREKLASENKHPSFPSKPKFKKTEDKAKQIEAPKKEKKARRKEEPKNKAKEAKDEGALLIHYSTDYTYSGEMRQRPYSESDSPTPNSTYGKTKLEGDNNIEKSGASYLIFKTGWVYSSNGKSFLRTILQLAGEQEELRVVDDQIGTPTWCRSIAEATGTIVEQLLQRGGSSFPETVAEVSGVYHMTCGGRTSWHGFARSILDLADPTPQPQLVGIPTRDYSTPACRPAYSVLSNAKLKATFDIVLPDWVCSYSGDGSGRCEESEGSGDHLIPLTNTCSHQGDQEGVRAGRNSDRVLCSTIIGDACLKFFHNRPKNKPA